MKPIHKYILDSDFLVSDSKGIHRLVGLKYDSLKMLAPEIFFFYFPTNISYAKHFAFISGKRIYQEANNLSARLCHRYHVGEAIQNIDDLTDVAYIYATFYKSKKK